MAKPDTIILRVDEIGDLSDRLAIAADRIAMSPAETEMNTYGADVVADLRIAARLLRYVIQTGMLYFPITLD